MIDPLGAETGPAYQTLGHVDALPAGTRLGEFEIQGLLGFGGFGMVYKGYDHSLERSVAIKEYMPAALVARSASHALSARSSSDAHTFQAGLKSFITEARLLARFDHPSLVKVYRFWEANNTAYMAMPLYQGITLKQARQQMSAPPPEDWFRVILWSVLEALRVLHSSDALHRDVSPDNIFLQDQGPPVLLDLGAARLAVMEGHKKHTAILKVNYAPIEQYADLSDMREGPWTDIYALAAVIHGCICNEAPLPATLRVVRDRLPSMAKIAKTTEAHFGQSYSPAFIKAVDQALSVQPGERPASVEAFAKALRLRSVSHPQRFDWRAALGDKVSLTSAGAVAQSVAFGASASVDDTLPLGKTKVVLAAKPAVVKPSGRSVRRPSSRRRSPWQVAVLAACFVLLLAIAIAWAVRSGVNTPLSTAATTPEANTQPVAASSGSSISPESDPSMVLKPLQPASAQSPGPVALVQPRPLGGGRSPAKPTRPADEPRATTVSEPAPAPADKVEPVEAPHIPEAPKPKRDAIALCPDSNLFTRPMCVYRECQKPENKSLQVCIDDRKRWEERDRLNRPQ